jgi:hypothetical protein
MIKQIAIGIGLAVMSLPLLAGERLPQDVEKFIVKRESCDHFRGEIPAAGERRRMKEVNREIEKWCKGTDKRLAELKSKYAANSAVMLQLDEFEQDVEAVQGPGMLRGENRCEAFPNE